MTFRECAIVTAYTGIIMLTEDKIKYFYQYLEELFKNYNADKEFLKFVKNTMFRSLLMRLTGVCGNSVTNYRHQHSMRALIL